MAIGLETLTRSEEHSLLEEIQEEVFAPEDQKPRQCVKPKRRNRNMDSDYIDTLKLYFDEVSRIPRVSQPEIVGLKLSQTEEVSQNALVEANLRLVVNIANRFKKYGLPLNDLIQEGNLGLIKAAEKYDWKKGYMFSTYAAEWIKAYILLAITEKNRTIKIPVKTLRKIIRIKKQRNRLAQNGETPTTAQIAKAAGYKKTDVEKYLYYGSIKTISLGHATKSSRSNGHPRPLEEMIADPQESVEDIVTGKFTRETLIHALSRLTEKQQFVIRERFLDPSNPSLQDIGTKLGLSRKTVFFIEKEALKKLRTYLYKYGSSSEV